MCRNFSRFSGDHRTMAPKLIPFNSPHFAPSTMECVSRSLQNGSSKGDGEFTRESKQILSRISGGGEVLLTPSCTHALEMASMLIGIGPGDEVILPAFTFTSAATAIVQFGATPVFVDIDPNSKNIDCNLIESSITPKTKAISFVNYAGVGADFSRLKEIAAKYKLFLIEDNAHGLGGFHQGKELGSFGDFSTLSFHESKNIQCGEGGALIINNESFIERASIVREKGTNRSKFIKGQVQKYEWVDKGSSYLLSDILAGVLLSQLRNFKAIQSNRMKTWKVYDQELKAWASQNGVKTHFIPEGSHHTAHMYYLELKDEGTRTKLMNSLEKVGIDSVFHYQGLHKSPAGRKYGRALGNFDNTNRVESTLLRLPLFYGISDSDVKRTIQCITGVML
jgi:dTDP-4-amino-4,6-dideoxygalactose transaminase